MEENNGPGSAAYWKDKLPQTMSAVMRIASRQWQEKVYLLMVREENGRGIDVLNGKSFLGIYTYFLEANSTPDEIKHLQKKFPHLSREDFAVGPDYVMRQALKINPRTPDEWIERINLFHMRKTAFNWREPGDAINKEILEKAMREVYFVHPEMAEEFRFDYYNLNKFMPVYRLNTMILENNLFIDERSVKLGIPFLDGVSLEGMYMAYDKDIVAMLNRLFPSGYPPEHKNALRDMVRMTKVLWKTFLERFPGQMGEFYWHLSLLVAQEKRKPVESLRIGDFHNVKFVRFPDSSNLDLTGMVFAFGNWDNFYKNIIQPGLRRLNQEVQEIEELFRSGKHIPRNKFSLWAVRAVAEEALREKLKMPPGYIFSNEEILNLKMADIKNTLADAILSRALLGPDLSFFRATLFIDLDLNSRIELPLNTADYILKLFYDYSSKIWEELPVRIRKDIRKTVAELTGRDASRLSAADYAQTNLYELVQKDPLNLFSPDEKLLFQLAVQDSGRQALKRMTLYLFAQQEKK